VGGLDVTATFATTGDVSGHLRLARHGEVICDRPLAKGVEDNDAQWTSDPRFNAWRTNEYMRAAIGVDSDSKPTRSWLDSKIP
jgi:hypothetical protein